MLQLKRFITKPQANLSRWQCLERLLSHLLAATIIAWVGSAVTNLTSHWLLASGDLVFENETMHGRCRLKGTSF